MKRYVLDSELVDKLTDRAKGIIGGDDVAEARKEIILDAINDVMKVKDCQYVERPEA